MKIYTKTGDNGTTGLFAGARVSKHHPRISAYGTIDELNALLGMLLAEKSEPAVPPVSETIGLTDLLLAIQSDLFSIGAELATPEPEKNGMQLLSEARVRALEDTIDQLEAQLPTLTSFILPGGSQAAAMLHLARTVCRRAEREVVWLTEHDPLCRCDRVIIYLNRLSDLLFVMARYENHTRGLADIPWVKPGA